MTYIVTKQNKKRAGPSRDLARRVIVYFVKAKVFLERGSAPVAIITFRRNQDTAHAAGRPSGRGQYNISSRRIFRAKKFQGARGSTVVDLDFCGLVPLMVVKEGGVQARWLNSVDVRP